LAYEAMLMANPLHCCQIYDEQCMISVQIIMEFKRLEMTWKPHSIHDPSYVAIMQHMRI